MPPSSSREFYAARISQLSATLKLQETELGRFANARLITFFLAALFGVLAYRGMALGWIVFAVPVIAFIVLMRKHDRLSKQHDHDSALLRINEHAIDVIEDRWGTFPDDGTEFRDPEHRYGVDLDIFGQASVFQWMNRTQTHAGRHTLARRLLEDPREIPVILADQHAILELSPRVEWRQDFQATGMQGANSTLSPAPLLAWVENSEPWYSTTYRTVCRILAPVTVIACALAYWNQIEWSAATALLVLQTLIFFSRAKRNFLLTEEIRRHLHSIRAFAGMASTMESASFSSPRLVGLQRELQGTEEKASEAIASLKSLVEWLDVQRIPIVHLPLNALLLYDFHFLFRLQDWKLEYGSHLRRWLAAIGEMESLASFAAIHYDNPEWAIPQLTGGEPDFQAGDLGHPLIPRGRRVSNSLTLEKAGQVLVLTGSNMSGKSTFMRTIGVNLVLAYAGAPVCATQLRTSTLHLYTSMRNTDNLEKNISSFYAELLRVRMILDAAKTEKPILFLMDEIFRGTNSIDRYTGAVAVLQRLSKMGAVGLVSTHDLELGKLPEQNGEHFASYHFAEGYEGGKITFDYRLRPGVCPSRNAIPLMRMVGIID